MKCFHCGAQLAVNVCLTKPGDTPDDGDYTICGGCGGRLVFEGDTTRAATDKESLFIDKLLRAHLF
jgi:transcription elongation factor Elf1